jgi:hypothetical protein
MGAFFEAPHHFDAGPDKSLDAAPAPTLLHTTFFKTSKS